MLRKKVILYDIQISIYNAFMDKSREIIMNKWNELKSEHYEGPYCIDYKGGMIDFDPEGMDDVRGSNFKNYDEYLDIQEASCGKIRKYLQFAYYNASDTKIFFKGQIEKIDCEAAKVLFKRIVILGTYYEITSTYGKEDHIWMDRVGFEGIQAGDCIEFEAEIYRYMRYKKKKKIDYALENPSKIKKINEHMIPSDQDLVDQQIKQLVCETCNYANCCHFGNCIVDKKVVSERIELLKRLQPGKFTPYTVLLAYELEYHLMAQCGPIKINEFKPDLYIMKRIVEICKSQPIHYTANILEPFIKMLNPKKPRI